MLGVCVCDHRGDRGELSLPSHPLLYPGRSHNDICLLNAIWHSSHCQEFTAR